MKLGAFGTLMAGLVLAFSPQGASSQDETLKPLFGSAKLKAGFEKDPYAKEVKAGGKLKVGKDRTPAFITKAPHFILEYEAGKYPLTIHAKSEIDTTLLILLPDGTWKHNDDRSKKDQNPLLRFAKPQSGKYTIWVGTIDNKQGKAKLFITEV